MFPAAPGSIEIDNARRVRAAPTAVIPGQSPEIAGFGFATPRVENRCRGLVHKEFRRPFQVIGQPVDNRTEVECSLADPSRQR
jgi:hypothetical protein